MFSVQIITLMTVFTLVCQVRCQPPVSLALKWKERPARIWHWCASASGKTVKSCDLSGKRRTCVLMWWLSFQNKRFTLSCVHCWPMLIQRSLNSHTNNITPILYFLSFCSTLPSWSSDMRTVSVFHSPHVRWGHQQYSQSYYIISWL